jgi:Spy/CpxP family protein refolding chaperone
MYRPLLMLALATVLTAQQPPASVPPAPQGRSAQEGHILAQFYQLRVTRIQQCLGVSEDRARDMAERWGRWDRDFIGRSRQMVQLRAQLNQVLMGAGPEDDKNARVKPLVDQFLALRQQQEDAKHRFEAEVLKALTPAQQARMILLVEDIQSRIRDTLREARKGGGKL